MTMDWDYNWALWDVKWENAMVFWDEIESEMVLMKGFGPWCGLDALMRYINVWEMDFHEIVVLNSLE